MDSTLKPPRPSLVFRVGVIGHRWNKLGATTSFDPARGARVTCPASLVATAEVERRGIGTVQRLLAAIRQELANVASEAANGYTSDTPKLVVVSSLAEGADRVVARAGLELDGGPCSLWAVLPFDQAEFERDFSEQWDAPSLPGPDYSRPGALEEFRELLAQADATVTMDRAPKPYQYVGAGRTVLAHSDVLIAVWDGSPAAGPGGTAQIVADARAEGVPIIRVDCQTLDRIWLDDKPLLEEPAQIAKHLRRLVAPPESAAERAKCEAYFNEVPTRGRLGQAFGTITSYLDRLRLEPPREAPALPSGALTPAQEEPVHSNRGLTAIASSILMVVAPTLLAWPVGLWRAIFPRLPKDPRARRSTFWGALRREASSKGNTPSSNVAEVLEKGIGDSYGWVNTLAEYYANRYRSAFTWIFSLAWVAAVAAVAGLVTHEIGWEYARVFAAAEATAIAGVLGMVWWGTRRRFHERWVDYRLLAEQFRHLLFIWPLGISTPHLRLPAAPSVDDSRARWVGWYYRAFVRQLGLATTRFDQPHLEACRAILQAVELRLQARYHWDTRHKYERYHEVVHRRTVAMVVAALPVALLHLTPLPEAAAHWLGVEPLVTSGILATIAVFLPSRAAALHGWATHADFQGAAIRSGQIREAIVALDQLVKLLNPTDSAGLSRIALETARLMEGELGAWRTTALAKMLTPA
ncbi:MAG: hypothetical protein ACKVZ0_06315 [Gemmatimonadales bacterium]